MTRFALKTNPNDKDLNAMKFTDFLWVVLFIALIARAVETHADDKLPTTNKADRPNIILIMADDKD